MSYTLVLDNLEGNQLTFEMGGPFTITEIQGLSPAEANINTTETPLLDGGKFNSSKVNMRTLNVAFAIEYGAEYNRLTVYKVLRPKYPIRLSYTSDVRDVYIDGYVQNVEISHFEMKQIVTTTIICPFPFFMQAQTVINEISAVKPMFHFPFASTAEPQLVFGEIDPLANIQIDNNGSLPCGLIIEMYASAEVSNPKIFDYVTGDYIGINFTFQAGDVVTIDTRQGEKTITLLRNGVTSNIFNSLMNGSTWLQLATNGGVYTYEVGSGIPQNLMVTINHFDLFEGV